jgi:hypothetical protein
VQYILYNIYDTELVSCFIALHVINRASYYLRADTSYVCWLVAFGLHV